MCEPHYCGCARLSGRLFFIAVQTVWMAFSLGGFHQKGEEVQTQSTQTVSVQEAGEILGIGRVLAYRLAKSGELPVLRLGQRRLRVPTAALEEWMKHPDGASGKKEEE